MNFWTPSAHWGFEERSVCRSFQAQARYEYAACGGPSSLTRYARLPDWPAWETLMSRTLPTLHAKRDRRQRSRQGARFDRLVYVPKTSFGAPQNQPTFRVRLGNAAGVPLTVLFRDNGD